MSLLVFDGSLTGPGFGPMNLVVSEITWTPSLPNTGEEVRFSARITNIGGTASPAGTICGVSFRIDGNNTNFSWSDNYTQSILPGHSVVLTANGGQTKSTWTAVEGDHTVLAWVDDVNRYGALEPSKADNISTQIVSVQVVVPPPPQQGVLPFLTGVNLAGAEFGCYGSQGCVGVKDAAFVMPLEREFDYFISLKRMNCIRFPFRWERLQRTLNGDFDTTYQTHVDNAVNWTTYRGAYCILDSHNYARYEFDNWTIGSGNVPNSAFADFWSRVATRYKDNPKVIYGLTNEPNNISSTQMASAYQAAINAIRATGSTQYILVGGNTWSGAWNWFLDGNDTAMAGLTDSANKLIFEVHQYPDPSGGGSEETCVAPADFVARFANFTTWCRNRGAKAFVGEWNFGNNTNCFNAATAFMQYAKDNQDVYVGWTHWAAGRGWCNGNDNCPTTALRTLNPNYTTTPPTDHPTMSIVIPFLPQQTTIVTTATELQNVLNSGNPHVTLIGDISAPSGGINIPRLAGGRTVCCAGAGILRRGFTTGHVLRSDGSGGTLTLSGFRVGGGWELNKHEGSDNESNYYLPDYDYLRIENCVTCYSYRTGWFVAGGQKVEIVNSTLFACPRDTCWEPGVRDYLFEGNLVQHCGDDGWGTHQGSIGNNLVTKSVICRNNTFRDCFGLKGHAGALTGTHNGKTSQILMENNVFEACGLYGFYFWEDFSNNEPWAAPRNIILRGNTFRDLRRTTRSSGNQTIGVALILGFPDSSYDSSLRIENNTFTKDLSAQGQTLQSKYTWGALNGAGKPVDSLVPGASTFQGFFSKTGFQPDETFDLTSIGYRNDGGSNQAAIVHSGNVWQGPGWTGTLA